MTERDTTDRQQYKGTDPKEYDEATIELGQGDMRSDEKRREDEDMQRHAGEASATRGQREGAGAAAPYDVASPGTPGEKIIRKGEREKPGPTAAASAGTPEGTISEDASDLDAGEMHSAESEV